jgi:hypothetical protein
MLAIAVLSFLAAGQTQAADAWLQASDYADVTVVVAESASADEQLAAEEFQQYWEKTTGYRPVIADAATAGPDVLIGAVGAGNVSTEELGEDGLIIQTLPSGDMVIAGETPRGSLNGVYEFFERFLGVRWFAWDLTHVPEAAPESVPAINHRYVPPFRFRWTNTWYGEGDSGTAYRRAHRLRQPVFGGEWGHNVLTLVPGPKYFAEHPEYFGMNKAGKRTTVETWERYNLPLSERGFDDVFQLCMTNPDVPGVIMEGLREWHSKAPDAELYCVMQEDTDNRCYCPVCQAIDEEQGTPMGSMLTGLNRLADLWAKEYPDKGLLTFAYAYTRTPPKTLKPHDNISFLLCTIECDFLRPIGPDSSEENVTFYNDLQDWAKLTNNLMVYDYAPNFGAWLRPHPNLHVIVPNIKTYAENGASGVFMQGDCYGSGDFVALRGYLIAQALWNPEVDYQAATDEFMNLYYGAAAPYLKQYIELMTQTALENDALITCFDDGTWMDAVFFSKATSLMHEAMAAATSDETRRRAKREWLALQYAGLTNCASAERVRDGYVLTRPAEVDTGEFLALCQEFGIRQLDEQYGRSGIPPVKVSVEEHLGPVGVRKPREEYTALMLENNRYLVEILPGFSGAVTRYLDKEWGHDVFGGPKSVETDRWLFQEWNMRGEGQPLEEPFWSEYRVIEASRNRVILETQLISGLILRRTASLPPGNGPLEMAWELSNPTEEALQPRFKIHPEFMKPGMKVPEIWIEKDNVWQERPVVRLIEDVVGGEAIDPAGISRWAVRLPDERQTIVVDIQPEDWESLFYFFNTDKEHVNMELIPRQTPLQPGETRTMRASYQLGRRLP